jgi:hypothetical protein
VAAGLIAIRESTERGLRRVKFAMRSFPSNSAVAAWQVSPLGASARTRGIARLERDTYALGMYIRGKPRRVHPFLQFTNLTNTVYEEIHGYLCSRGRDWKSRSRCSGRRSRTKLHSEDPPCGSRRPTIETAPDQMTAEGLVDLRGSQSLNLRVHLASHRTVRPNWCGPQSSDQGLLTSAPQSPGPVSLLAPETSSSVKPP